MIYFCSNQLEVGRNMDEFLMVVSFQALVIQLSENKGVPTAMTL